MQWWNVTHGKLLNVSMSSAMGWSTNTAGGKLTSGKGGLLLRLLCSDVKVAVIIQSRRFIPDNMSFDDREARSVSREEMMPVDFTPVE